MFAYRFPIPYKPCFILLFNPEKLRLNYGEKEAVCHCAAKTGGGIVSPGGYPQVAEQPE